MTDTDLFDIKSFLAVFSQIADFGIRTMTGKKRDNLRNSSRILSGGIETMSSSKNNGIEFASLEDCPVLVLALKDRKTVERCRYGRVPTASRPVLSSG